MAVVPPIETTVAKCLCCGQEMHGTDYLQRLRADRDELENQRGNLSMLVRSLVHKVRLTNPQSDLAQRAMSYLISKGLQGSILRGDNSVIENKVAE